MFNKNHKKYDVDPTPAKRCRITNGSGLFYHPTKAPDGLCKCGVMLELCPKKTEYKFISMRRAIHAKEHTIKYLKSIDAPFNPDNYVIEVVT